MEFLLEDGEVLASWELEPGVRARMVISTEAGLYRYDLADEIEVIGRCRQTAVIRFVGKAGRYLNSTGEKVSEAQVSEATHMASVQVQERPRGMTCRIRWGEIPCLELAVEGCRDAEALGQAFDLALAQLNPEYREKRESERIGAVCVHRLAEGAYQRVREARVAAGAPEGQVKDPILALTQTEWDAVCGLGGRP
jgi:hypothetical protein